MIIAEKTEENGIQEGQTTRERRIVNMTGIEKEIRETTEGDPQSEKFHLPKNRLIQVGSDISNHRSVANLQLTDSPLTSKPDSEYFNNGTEAGETVEDDDDAAMMAAMGMAGFGTTKVRLSLFYRFCNLYCLHRENMLKATRKAL